MNQALINSSNLLWRVTQCCYCQKPFTTQDLTNKNYRLSVYAASQNIKGLVIMVFHKQCWVECNQVFKTAYQQIINDPIYRWSRGDWKS